MTAMMLIETAIDLSIFNMVASFWKFMQMIFLSDVL